MVTVTEAELSENIGKILDRVELGREEIIVVRNNRPIARIVPGAAHMTALEAMADLYRTLEPEAAEGWLEESRINGTLSEEIRDPWDS